MSKTKISFADFAKKLGQPVTPAKPVDPTPPVEFIEPQPVITDGSVIVRDSEELSQLESPQPSTDLIPFTEPVQVDEPTDGPGKFRFELDRLDSLMYKDIADPINTFNVDAVKETVMRIMLDLKANPSYDGLIIDKDVHNIFRFIRFTGERATMNDTAAKVNRQVKAEKNKKISFSADAQDDFMPKSLSDMAKMEF